MKIILLCLSLIVVALFLFGCTNEEVETADGAEDETALAGEASFVSSINHQVLKNEFFALAVTNANIPDYVATVGEIFEYMGADRISMTQPKIKFKQISNGETRELAIVKGRATLRVGGKSFLIKLVTPRVVDSPIQIDYDGDGTFDTINVKTLKYKSLSLYGEGFSCRRVNTAVEGESVEILDLAGNSHTVNFVDITSDRIAITFDADPEIEVPAEEKLVGQSFYYSPSGIRLHVINTLSQDYAGGVHEATYCY